MPKNSSSNNIINNNNNVNGQAVSKADLYQQVREHISSSAITSNRVEVNQRALIDKILARYATASAVYRELLQNSNDAGASKAEILFTTQSDGGTVAQVVYRNNGMPFRPQDWDRLQKIAEGNPDVTKVGAFGVGAYTMFSITEEPIIVSGDKCLVFMWKGDALYTKQAPNKHVTEWTTFLLPSRDPYPLPDWTEFGEFLTAALTFTNALRCISVSVNGMEKLKIEKSIVKPPQPVQPPPSAKVSKSSFLWTSLSNSSDSLVQSSSGIFYLPRSNVKGVSAMHETLVCVTVTVDLVAVAQMDAQYISAMAQTKISTDMNRRMERVTKKKPPPQCLVQIFLNYDAPVAKLVSSDNGTNSSTVTSAAKKAVRIAQSFAPRQGQGRIFIGFRTSQTTGLGAHVSAPFVPTVEREAMDLQDAVLAQFNRELLEFSGILLRLTLEHTMRNVIDSAWHAGEKDRLMIEANLLQELNQRKGTIQKSAPKESVLTCTDDSDKDDTNTTATATGLLGFARFMAIGVKKNIVNVAKSAAALLDGDGSDDLLNPPDPRPLSEVEQRAIVLMSSFCPEQSTPDPAIGTWLALGFSNCLPGLTPPVLTKSGVVPGNDARMPVYGIEQFCSNDVIRKVVFENAREYHTVIARCRELSFDDLLDAILNCVLTEEQTVTLVKWSARFAKINSCASSQIESGRLKEAVRFHPTNDATAIVKLSEYFFFVEKESLRDLPLPLTVLPDSMQQKIGLYTLKSEALLNTWFESLSIENWAHFISNHRYMNDAIPEDDLSRVNILTVLSHEYMSRHISERAVFGDFLRSLLSSKRCVPFDSEVPTKYAAAFPSDLYLPSAELKAFNGVGSFHKVSRLLLNSGVTDDFLLSLGVRKSVTIDFLFGNLETLSWNKDPKPLVEYLRSATLTRSDLNKLSTTRYLPAVDILGETFAPTELFLPSEDIGIFPFVNVLKWPSETEVSEKSANGKFLVKLGIKTTPSLPTILEYLSVSDISSERLVQGLDFVCERLVPHGAYYPQYKIMGRAERKQYSFIPCIVTNPITGQITSERFSPLDCFSNLDCAIMGFPVIDSTTCKNAKMYGSLLECDAEPSSTFLLRQLIQLSTISKREQLAATFVEQLFSTIFKYLSDRSSDIDCASLNTLKNEPFIPCKMKDKIVWQRPDEVFFKRTDHAIDSLTEDLFHVISFSPFLATVGVREEATTKDLFQKMIAQPDEVLRLLGSEKKYRLLLRRIAADPPFPLSHPSPDIKKAPFLLGYTPNTPVNESDDTKVTYHLSRAEDIFVIDNSNYGRMFPVYRAPPESDLEDFYVHLGSRYISKAVDRRFEVVGSPRSNTELTNAFRTQLRERGPLLVSPMVTSRPLVSGASSVLEEKVLDILEATSLMAVFSLGKISRRSRTTCFSRKVSLKRNAIYFTKDLDMFDAGMAVGDLILKRCQLEDAFFISSLLEAPLDQLRARGFPVDRIIKQPEAIAVPDAIQSTSTASVTQTPTTSYPTQSSINIKRSVSTNEPPEQTHVEAKRQEETSTGSKADILMQMFPDADRSYVEAVLGSHPTVDDVRILAENMTGGHYPKSTTATSNKTVMPSSDAASEIKNAPLSMTKKNMRKLFGRPFSGRRGGGSKNSIADATMDSSSQETTDQTCGNVVLPSKGDSSKMHTPVPPASDAMSQAALEQMLENSVNSTNRVQNRDLDLKDSKLISLPEELDRGVVCEVVPGHSLTPFFGLLKDGKTHNGIRVFASKTHPSSESFLNENEESLALFGDVIKHICVDVFGLEKETIAIYHDPAGNSIAFNNNRALHFNFRFFHALHYLQNKYQTSECYSYWFITTCHELAHNFVSAHNRDHGFYTESFSSKFLPKFATVLRQLSIE